MSTSMAGELIWLRSEGKIALGLYLLPTVRNALRPFSSARVSNLKIPVLARVPRTGILYRHPIGLTKENGVVKAGPVFAILAASGDSSFIGSRANFRDIIQTARKQNSFAYVLSVRDVNDHTAWLGYVRTGYQKWIPIPCPRPEAVYNRIPNRALERTDEALTAKALISAQRIPMFNPDYFNKANIYDMLRHARLGRHLPDTVDVFSWPQLQAMLTRHSQVYLKPAGGSVGHGMIRISRQGRRYEIVVQKNSRCQTWSTNGFVNMCGIVRRERLPGHYVIQEARELIQWQGRPCDFRVLLQKRGGDWIVVGKGVRVSGANTITTHVPSGGYIASAKRVLMHTFGNAAADVECALEKMVVSCAEAIDVHYQAQLGEMSMDIGVDEQGNLWFFEANAKPMKFDEKDIREQSLTGVLAHLEELRKTRPIAVRPR